MNFLDNGNASDPDVVREKPKGHHRKSRNEVNINTMVGENLAANDIEQIQAENLNEPQDYLSNIGEVVSGYEVQ